jgi:hypothetical protein
LVVRTPVLSRSPRPLIATSPSVFSRGVPYLTALGPAELYARLPPMVQLAALVGSGGQKKPDRTDRLLELLVDDPRLDDGKAVLGGDPQDSVHPLEREHDPSAVGHGCAGGAGPAPSCSQGGPVFIDRT